MSEKRDPFDGEYIGSIFGPKLTLYGGILILLFTGLALYRHWSLGVPFGLEEQPIEESISHPLHKPDTLKLKE
jgi:hypothetical protein